MHSSRPVPAFFDADEPPQQLPVLSSQSEMYYRPKNRVRVSAMEEMSLSHHPIAVPATNAKLTAKMPRTTTPGISSRATTPREATPITKPSGKVGGKSVTIIEDYEGSPGSPSSSELTESTLLSWDKDKESDKRKIPKPNGEVGQPGRGGYNLEDQLGWGRDGFKNLKRFVKKAVRKHLDPTKCRSLQNRRALETVNKTAIAEFPDLDDFEGCWPVQDLVLLQLKYSSFRARQQQRDRTTPPHETLWYMVTTPSSTPPSCLLGSHHLGGVPEINYKLRIHEVLRSQLRAVGTGSSLQYATASWNAPFLGNCDLRTQEVSFPSAGTSNGAKLFYLSGILNGQYPDTEILNLSRFISVMKFRPLIFRNSHPYLLADCIEDLTPRETIRASRGKCDRTVTLYRYLRGTNLRQSTKVHIPGVGDMSITSVKILGDPCPLPDADSEKWRKLSEKKKLLVHAPMSDVGGVIYDKDAVWINVPGNFTRGVADVPLGKGEKMVMDLQDVDATLADMVSRSQIKLLGSLSN
ncbi:NUC121 domain-containing protein [Pisolithus croceorrhizus]|nr:NUC121 domain-containing protein [Pisolithus croceorrhizus]